MTDEELEISYINDTLEEYFGSEWNEKLAGLTKYLVSNGIGERYLARNAAIQEVYDKLEKYNRYTQSNIDEWGDKEWCKGWACAIHNVKYADIFVGVDRHGERI